MPEIKFPVKINRDAERIAEENLLGIVEGYLSRSGPQQEFVRHEVDLKGGYVNEKPLPNMDIPHTVLIGKWKRHSENGLFIRAGIVRIDSVDYDNILSLVEENEAGYIKWACRRLNQTEDFKHYEPNFRLSLDELRRAHELSREFIAAAQSYFWINESKRRNQ